MLARKRGSGGARGARSRVRCAAPKRRPGDCRHFLSRACEGDGDIYPVCHLSDLESDLSGHSCQLASSSWPPMSTLFSGKANGKFVSYSSARFVPALRMGFRVARRLRFARTAPRATLGAFPEGVGSAKDVPPGAMGSRTGEAAAPFLRKVCVRASRNDEHFVVCASRMARFFIERWRSGD